MATKVYARTVRIDELNSKIAMHIYRGRYEAAEALKSFFPNDYDENEISEVLKSYEKVDSRDMSNFKFGK
jgi:hypothetical protein